MYNRFKSVTLVVLQFLLISLLLINTPVRTMRSSAYVFLFPSAILIFWSTAAMQKSKLRITPEPSADAVLITNGPYRFIRHPMYAAILIGCTGLLIGHFSFLSLAYTIALVIVLMIKLTWEEKMLSRKFEGYTNYMKHTARLFPLIF